MSYGCLLEEVLTSAGKGLEDVSWKASSGRLPEDVIRSSRRRRLDDVFKKVVANSTSDISKTSLRPKIRRFYDVFVSADIELIKNRSKVQEKNMSCKFWPMKNIF